MAHAGHYTYMAKKKQKIEEPEIVEIGKESTEKQKFMSLTVELIKDQMYELGLRQVDIARELDIKRSNLSAYLNEKDPIPDNFRKLLYYFFKLKTIEKNIKNNY